MRISDWSSDVCSSDLDLEYKCSGEREIWPWMLKQVQHDEVGEQQGLKPPSPPQGPALERLEHRQQLVGHRRRRALRLRDMDADLDPGGAQVVAAFAVEFEQKGHRASADARAAHADVDPFVEQARHLVIDLGAGRSEEHTSELPSLNRLPYAVL